MNLQQLKEQASKKVDIVKQYKWDSNLGDDITQINSDLETLGEHYTIRFIQQVKVKGREREWLETLVVFQSTHYFVRNEQ